MNVAVYVRVSPQRQAQAQTIEQQLERLQEYYQTQGCPWQEDHIFRDDGYSEQNFIVQVLTGFGNRSDVLRLTVSS